MNCIVDDIKGKFIRGYELYPWTIMIEPNGNTTVLEKASRKEFMSFNLINLNPTPNDTIFELQLMTKLENSNVTINIHCEVLINTENEKTCQVKFTCKETPGLSGTFNYTYKYNSALLGLNPFIIYGKNYLNQFKDLKPE